MDLAKNHLTYDLERQRQKMHDAEIFQFGTWLKA
jgi:hypothetical protein